MMMKMKYCPEILRLDGNNCRKCFNACKYTFKFNEQKEKKGDLV